MNVIKYSALVCLAGLLATPLHAEPRTIDDCEKIQAADAYNQCLGSFGPVAKEHNLRPADAAKAPAAAAAEAKGARGKGTDATVSMSGLSSSESRATRGRHGYRGRRSYRASASRGGGRRSMSFTVRHRRHR